MYIVFEGIVGTGKSTQANRLYQYLKERFPNTDIIHVREPGSTVIAEKIRILAQGTKFEEEMDSTCEAYLFAAARAELLQKKVKPTLDKGGIVISDRCLISSLAYQGYARDVGIDAVMDINTQAVKGCLPDCIIYLQGNIDESLKRTFDADGDKFETYGKEFFLKLQRGYNQVSRMPQFTDHWHEVNCDRTIDEVYKDILTVVENHVIR